MSLSKKKSRAITVGEREYRWQFFENSGWNDVTIQDAEGTGAKLVVQFTHQFARDHKSKAYIDLLPPVTPKIVMVLIEKAIELGWRPTCPGKPWRRNWSDNNLIQI